MSTLIVSLYFVVLLLALFSQPHSVIGAYCGKFSGLSGIVKSPTRDPLTGLYPPNTRCDYRIKTPRGYTIRATFNEFNLQWSSYCQSDYVKHTQIKNKWNDRAYCGQHLKGRTVETCDNRLFIRFVSDSVRNGKGFNMAYTAVDINECLPSRPRGCKKAATQSVCEQICINTRGSFRCSCQTGFHLSLNGRSCERDIPSSSLPPLKVGHCPSMQLGKTHDVCSSGSDNTCPTSLKCCPTSGSTYRCKEPVFAFRSPHQLSTALQESLLSLTDAPRATGRVAGQTTTCQSTCLTILLDRSGSIGYSNFKSMLNFLSALLTSMCARAPCLSTLAISYASDVRVELECGQYKCGQGLYEAVKGIRYRSGFTFLDLALEMAKSKMTGSASRDCGRASGSCQQIVFLLTDGKSNGDRDPVVLARQLERDTGAKIFTFGVTEKVNGSELSAVASQELVNVNGNVVNRNVFMLRTFRGLDDLAKILNGSDPCSVNNGGCEHVCVNSGGTAQCTCRNGFSPLSQGSPFCKQNVHPCNQHQRGGCQHNCVAQGSGFVCSCRNGYELGTDGKSCSDVNECRQSNGRCQQLCMNKAGSYRCHCRTGFLLQTDGRTCQRTCQITDVQGQCRIRKEIYSMTTSERRHFIRIFKLITTQPPYKSLYDDLIAIHEREFDNGIHTPQQFLPWHRWFVLSVENLLRCADRTVTIPYWDYSYTCRSPWKPNVLCLDDLWGDNLQSLGGNGTGRFHQVATGPFAYPGWRLTPSAETNALRRAFRERDVPCLPAIERFLALPCSAGTIEDVDVALAGPLHSPIHFGINGTMWSQSSANTPEFYLLHSFIDKLWSDWQRKGQKCAQQHTTSPDFVMTATGGVRVRDVQMMERMVVNGSVVCVRYDEPSHCLVDEVLGRLTTNGKSWHSIPRLPSLPPSLMTREEATFIGRDSRNVQKMLDMDRRLRQGGAVGRSSSTRGWSSEELLMGFQLSGHK